jgi:hypothetical protein
MDLARQARQRFHPGVIVGKLGNQLVELLIMRDEFTRPSIPKT